MLGASSPDHFLLPADLSRHTRANDPLHGSGFAVAHHQSSWRTAWRSLSKAAGFPGLRFHDLRHSFISLMAEHGVPIQVVQAMVGHMSPAITKHYTHVSSDAARRAVAMLDQKSPQFVDVFVDTLQKTEGVGSKLLN
jgi:integrase